MLKQSTMGISEIRETLKGVLQEEAIPAGLSEAARDALASMCQEASEYGLSSADVIRSVLSPVFHSKSECGCPTCEFRRGEQDSVDHEPADHY